MPGPSGRTSTPVKLVTCMTKQKFLKKNLRVNLNLTEFELRGSGSPSRTCTLKLVIFMRKQKFLKKDLRVDYYSLLKHCMRLCIPVLLLPDGPNHLQNLTPNCKILNVF